MWKFSYIKAQKSDRVREKSIAVFNGDINYYYRVISVKPKFQL